MDVPTTRRRVCRVETSAGGSPMAAPIDAEGELAPLDPGAVGTAGPGTVVVAEPRDSGWRAVVKLAAAGSLKADLVTLAVSSGADPTYPPAVLAEAAARAASPDVDDPSLVDLRHLPWVTVDPAGSRDLDQALVVARAENGFLVRYAIADASWYVRPGGALFDDALARGASYYLPGFRVPMLPALLSEGVVSLNPGVDRRALVFEVSLDAGGAVRSTIVTRARVRSRRRLSYRRVQRAWDEPAGSGFRGEEFASSLELLREVGRVRVADAERRDAVSFHRRETEVVLSGGEQTGFSILSRDRLEVERCAEQLSLLVNVEGARLLTEALGSQIVQPIFRVHPSPSLEHLMRFEAQVESLVELHDLDPSVWRWRRSGGETLPAYLDRLPRAPHLRPVRDGIERQALLTNERSSYGAEPGPHFGVAAPVYARFSAPMREIVGIFTHKEALEGLGLEEARAVVDDLQLRDRVVEAGNRSRELQRRLSSTSDRLVLDRVFNADLARPVERRTAYRGTVLGVGKGRLYVALDDPPVELKVGVEPFERVLGSELRVDPYEVAFVDSSGTAQVAVGDRVSLRVTGHDPRRRLWLFEPTGARRRERRTPANG